MLYVLYAVTCGGLRFRRDYNSYTTQRAGVLLSITIYAQYMVPTTCMRLLCCTHDRLGYMKATAAHLDARLFEIIIRQRVGRNIIIIGT